MCVGEQIYFFLHMHKESLEEYYVLIIVASWRSEDSGQTGRSKMTFHGINFLFVSYF